MRSRTSSSSIVGSDDLERESDAEEALDDRVVEVAGQSLALFGERQFAHVRTQHLLVDHQARGPTEGLGELLVLFAEDFAVHRIGEIEIAEDMAVTRRDRHAEESMHRWVVEREAR